MFKNIIFDWSGVISDDISAVIQTVNKILVYYNHHPITETKYKDDLEYPMINMWRKWKPDIDHDELTELWDKLIHESKDPVMYPGMKNLLKNLSNSRELVVYSANPIRKLLQEVDKYGIRKFFKEINGLILEKDNQITAIMQRNGFNISETVIVGDTTDEIQAARAAGIKVVSVTWGYFTKEKLEKHNPDYIVDSVEELNQIL